MLGSQREYLVEEVVQEPNDAEFAVGPERPADNRAQIAANLILDLEILADLIKDETKRLEAQRTFVIEFFKSLASYDKINIITVIEYKNIDELILDLEIHADLIKDAKAKAEAQQKLVLEWYENTLSQNNKNSVSKSISPQQPSNFTNEDTSKERAEKIIFLIENHKEFKSIGKLDQQQKDYVLEKEEMILRGEYKRPSSHFATAFIVSVATARDMLTQNVTSSNTKSELGEIKVGAPLDASPSGEFDEPKSPSFNLLAGLTRKRKPFNQNDIPPYPSGSSSSAENESEQNHRSPRPGGWCDNCSVF